MASQVQAQTQAPLAMATELGVASPPTQVIAVTVPQGAMAGSALVW